MNLNLPMQTYDPGCSNFSEDFNYFDHSCWFVNTGGLDLYDDHSPDFECSCDDPNFDI